MPRLLILVTSVDCGYGEEENDMWPKGSIVKLMCFFPFFSETEGARGREANITRIWVAVFLEFFRHQSWTVDLWVKRRSSRGNLRTSHLPPRKLNKVPLNGWSLEKMCACKPVGVWSLCSLYLPSLDINFHSCSVYLSWFETSRDMKTLVISLLVTYDVHVLILNCNWGSYMDKLSFHLLSSLKGLGNFPSMQLSYVSFYQACDF